MNKYKFLIISLLSIFQVYSQIATTSYEKEYEELSLYYLLLDKEKKDSVYNKAFSEYERKLNTDISIDNEKDNLILKRYHTILQSPHNTEELLFQKIDALIDISQKAAKQKNINLELEAATHAFTLLFWEEPYNYSKAFSIAIHLEKKVLDITGQEFSGRKRTLLKLGEAYYIFKDFPKSISLLKQVISDTPSSFADNSNLEARKIIGICYANLNQMDSSDYYFKSTLKSKDVVLNRPMYNAVAISNLACNAMLTGQYKKATLLFNTVLPFIKTGNDFGHIAGMYYGMGNSYYNMGNYEKVGSLIDSIFVYANKDRYNHSKRIKQAFTLGSKYYTTVNNNVKALAYNDSLLYYYNMDESLYTSQYISNAIRQIKDAEIKDQNEKIKSQYHKIIFIFSACLFCLIIIFIISYLYIHKRTAYRMLVLKTEEWALTSNFSVKNSIYCISKDQTPTEEDRTTMRRIIQYVITDKNYKNPALTLNSLSKEISINRSYLSKAVNATTGKSFSEWLNESRIREAIHLLSMDHQNHSMDNIAFEIGYNNRTTFYRAFKKITGLSPTTYINNRIHRVTK